MSQAGILKLLEGGPMTARQLAEVMGIGAEGVRQCCLRMQELGLIHVSGEEVVHARRAASLWALGPGDRKPPSPRRMPMAARRHFDPDMADRRAPTRREDETIAHAHTTWWGSND